MKLPIAGVLTLAILITGSLTYANPTRHTTYGEVNLSKRFELSNKLIEQLNLQKKQNVCPFADYLWQASARHHMDYCRSNRCSGVMQTIIHCE